MRRPLPTSFLQLYLRFHDNCKAAVKGVTEVYHLAADMGGIGYISGSHATITLNNTLINAHMIAAVSQSSVEIFVLVVRMYLSAISPEDTGCHSVARRRRVPG